MARRCAGESAEGPTPTTLFPVTSREVAAFHATDASPAEGGSEDPASEEPAPGHGAAMRYPMYLMSWEVVMGLERMTPHQALRHRGQLTVWDEAMLGRVLLVSHEWLGYAHPDPAGEQLRELQGTLRHLASGQVSIHSDWKQRFYGKSTNRLPGRRLAAVLSGCYFWLDYAGIPQALAVEQAARTTADHRFERNAFADKMRDAVRSIPAYVERSAALLVLTPTCQHRDVAGRVCGFASWRSRGWCRVELCAALLSRTRVRLVRCVASAAAPEFMTGGEALFLPPGLGAYSCCARGHEINGRAIECDKMRISVVVHHMLEAAAEHLHEVGDAFRRRVLLCSGARFLRGLPHASVARVTTSETVMVQGFHTWLRWSREDAEAAGLGKAPSVLHWAALAGNTPVISALLALDARGIDDPMPMGAPEFGLTPHLSPLHLAAFCADGREGAMAALLDARANAELQDGGVNGRCVPMYAVGFGTLRQVECWFSYFPHWGLERRDRALGCTLLAHAAFVGPAKAPFIRLLLQRGADVRAGAGNTAAADAALLLACLKYDSDPEVVAMLLSAGCSPNARLSPPWWKWRAIYAGMRLAARCAALRGQVPRPLITALANAVGCTPLHLAAQNADTTVVHLLLRAAADPALRNAMGRTALELARVRFGGSAPDLVEALLDPGPGGGGKKAAEAPEEYN